MSSCAYGALCGSPFILSRHLQGRKLASRTFLRPFTRASRNFHFPVHPQSGRRERGAQLRVLSPILSPPGKPQLSCLVRVRPCYLWIPPARGRAPPALMSQVPLYPSRYFYSHPTPHTVNLQLLSFRSIFHVVYCFSLNPVISMILLCQV